MVGLLVGLILAGTAVFMLANRRWLRIAARNSIRRPLQSAFVVVGLAVSAMVFTGAAAIGDSLRSSLTQTALEKYGDVGAIVGPREGTISSNDLQRIEQQAKATGAEAIGVLMLPLTVTTLYGSYLAPGVQVTGVDPESGDARLHLLSGGTAAPLRSLAANEVYLGDEAAKQLHVKSGETILITHNGKEQRVTVRAVVETRGTVVGGASAFMRLPNAQELLGQKGEVNRVFVLFPQETVPPYTYVAPTVEKLRSGIARSESIPSLLNMLRSPDTKNTIEKQAATLSSNSILGFMVQRFVVELGKAPSDQIVSLLYEEELRGWLMGLSLPNATAAAEQLDKLTPFQVDDVRNNDLRSAQEQARQMTTLLLLFGVFATAAGVALIFIITSLLVQERVREIGIVRAIGAKRRKVALLLSLEGFLYSVAGAAVGVALGVLVSYLLVHWMARATPAAAFRLQPNSILWALFGGLLLNGVTVVAAAYRSGGFRIPEAMRGVMEAGAPKFPVFRRLLAGGYQSGVPLLLVGGGLLSMGRSAQWVSPVMLGVSLLLVGGLQLAGRASTWLGMDRSLASRFVHTLVGLGLIGLWAIPTSAMQWLGSGTYRSGLEVILLAGAMQVTGALCLVSQQAKWLFGLFVLPVRLVRKWLPVAHYAVVSAAQAPRTNAPTVGMVSLISFVVVMVFTTTHAMSGNRDHPDMWLRGYQLKVQSQEPIPLSQLVQDKPNLSSRIEAMGSRFSLPVFVDQVGQSEARVPYRLTLADNAYLTGAGRFGSKLAMRAPRFADDAAVWGELRSNPNVALITADAIVRRQNYNLTGTASDFQLKGFYAESKQLPQTAVEVKVPATQETRHYEIIGVIASAGEDYGLIASDAKTSATAAAAGGQREYFLRAKSPSDVTALRDDLNRELRVQNVAAVNLLDAFYAVWDEADADNKVLGAFSGLGLIVGLAAMGVLSARAVVQRRQQIGVLRALGYKRSGVAGIFLIESSVLSATGLVVGAIPALLLAFDVIQQMAKDSPAFTFNPPVPILLAFLLGSFGMSLLVTCLAALQAASVQPAEALRYE